MSNLKKRNSLTQPSTSTPFAQPTMTKAEPPVHTKIIAFAALVGIQVSVALLFKLSQSSGKYGYNPASAIALAEVVKLCISLGMYYNAGDFSSLHIGTFKLLAGPYAVLALIYCINNQLTFVLMKLTDPGTITLFKSTTPFLTAILQYVLFDTPLNNLQWSCIVLNVCGLVISEWDDCSGGLAVTTTACSLLVFACLLTAGSSVWNAHAIKKFDCPFTLQNSVLYTFGVIFNVLAFSFGLSGSTAGFFEGYSNPWALAVVASNGLIGFAITAVYKYGDAIVKTFATSVSAGTLIVMSGILFGARVTVTAVFGCMVVFIGSYVYFAVALQLKELLPVTNEEPVDERAKRTKKMLIMCCILGVFMVGYMYFGLASAGTQNMEASSETTSKSPHSRRLMAAAWGWQ